MNATSRPGLKTTEFWLALVSSLAGPLIAFLIASGTLAPETPEGELNEAIQQVLVGAAALAGVFMTGKGVKSYTDSRTNVKHMELQAQVAVLQQTTGESEEGSAIGFSLEIEDDEEEDDEDEDEEDDDDDAGAGIGFVNGQRL